MDTEVQPTSPHENGSKPEESPSEPQNGESPASNGKDAKISPKHLGVRQTRSRSRTPQKKRNKKSVDAKESDDNVNGHQTRSKRNAEPKPERSELVKEAEPTDKEEPINQEQTVLIEEIQVETETVVVESEVIIENSPTKSSEAVEMETLILGDEQDPELQFDETSDIDSIRSSPIQTRCKTRRSTRNASLTKSPKSATDSESEKVSAAPTPTPENLTDTLDEDVSTRAQIGSDTTRLEFMDNSSIASEDYVPNFNDASYRESIGRLSARRTIRPLNDSYRQRALKNSQNKSELNASCHNYSAVDGQLGVKRKRSPSPEDRKKFKEDNASFASYLSSPLSSFKRRFSTDFGSSPKLTAYKDSSNDIHEQELLRQEVVSEDDKKNRCSLM